jgi:hypothetical protein
MDDNCCKMTGKKYRSSRGGRSQPIELDEEGNVEEPSSAAPEVTTARSPSKKKSKWVSSFLYDEHWNSLRMTNIRCSSYCRPMNSTVGQRRKPCISARSKTMTFLLVKNGLFSPLTFLYLSLR